MISKVSCFILSDEDWNKIRNLINAAFFARKEKFKSFQILYKY
jgi:hypothetical protein